MRPRSPAQNLFLRGKIADIAERLQKEMTRQGLSHEALADKATLSQAGLSLFLKGKRLNVRLETLYRYAHALGLPMRDIMPRK